MRRKEKTIITFAGYGGAITAIGDFVIQCINLSEKNEKFSLNKIDWEQFMKNTLIGTGIGAGVGLLVYQIQLREEKEEKFYPEDYLRKILRDYSFKNNTDLLESALSKKEEIKNHLTQYFGTMLAGSPFNAGSHAKYTAIAGKSDFDIIVPFKRESFKTLEEMYEAVYQSIEFLENDAHLIEIRRQRCSIGLEFEVEGSNFHFDIVPGRAINDFYYKKDLNLYVAPDWLWEKPSSLKTNLYLHRKSLVGKKDEREIIKLLKIWSQINDLKFNSTFLQNLVIDCFKHNRYIGQSIFNQLKTTMEYIRSCIETKRIIDVANTNNIVSDTMTDSQKQAIASHLEADLRRLAKNERHLIEMFIA